MTEDIKLTPEISQNNEKELQEEIRKSPLLRCVFHKEENKIVYTEEEIFAYTE